MPTIEQPTPQVKQVSGRDPTGAWILAVLAKATYTWDRDFKLVPAGEPVPLVVDPVMVPEGRMLADCDLYPFKLKTDLILHGHAYGRKRPQFDVSIAVNEKPVKRIRVIGDREVASMGGDQIYFGPPAPVEKVPLTYEFAYGGIDKVAEATQPNPWMELAADTDVRDLEAQQGNRFRYPRNPVGKGYLVHATPAAVDALQLPNLEDPTDLLTPQRLAVGEPGYWYRMPLPQAAEWVDAAWFPRLAYLGMHPGTHDKPKSIPEIERGFAPKHILELRKPSIEDAFQLVQGASLGLQLPHFRCGEAITLENVHPTESKFVLRLPAARPKIWVDGRKGTMKETEPVIQTVVVEPDAKRVSVVWRGAAPALRPYLPEELEKMPLKVVW